MAKAETNPTRALEYREAERGAVTGLDAELIATCALARTHWAQFPDQNALSAEAFKAAEERWRRKAARLEKKVAATPATTLIGLAAKARLAQTTAEGTLTGTDADAELLRNVLGNLLSLAGEEP